MIKKDYVIYKRKFEKASNQGLVWNKMHRDNIFNQKAWLKSYIDNDFGKDFLSN